MANQEKKKIVAVVGSGLAGLVTTYLLHNDSQHRYHVILLEKKNEPSLSAESIALPKGDSEAQKWADVPMRAVAGGYYRNLLRMYDHLKIQYRAQNFVFSFARLPPTRKTLVPAPHMIHTSNFHTTPPMPTGVDVIDWIFDVFYVLIFYLWFTICCYFIAPQRGTATLPSESLDHYLRRIHLPQHYIHQYLLPLMSSVCTCTHDDLLRFPASDIIGYKQRTHRKPHYVVANGVHDVQEKLLDGIDARFGVTVTRVTSMPEGVSLAYLDADGIEISEKFDHVVLAISPDIIANIFEPLKDCLSLIPTTTVDTVAHTDFSTLPATCATSLLTKTRMTSKKSASTSTALTTPSSQNIHFRFNGSITEAAHEQSSSLIITTNPLIPVDASKIVSSANFTRILRTPESRRLVNRIFRAPEFPESQELQLDSAWSNGDGGVFLAGGWCWDGMVLLEGCVVSAMRVATNLGVEIPWETQEIAS